MLRRRKGATLGLVAIVVLVIIIIGVAVYFLTKLLSGGRETANATDAGTLNVARNSIKLPTVSAAGTDFDKLGGDPGAAPTDQISLLTYNRCVAQAMLVAWNASTQGGMGQANAQKEFAELQAIGTALTAALQSAGGFNNAAQLNNTRMWGNNGVSQSALATAYVSRGAGTNTNVYFLNGQKPPGAVLSTASTVKSSSGDFYMTGYVAQPAIGGVGPFYGVPVYPQQNPHLISIGDFKPTAAPAPATPPNAFRVDAQTLESKTSLLGGAVAAALVGASNAAGGKISDYAAAIPKGYIVFENEAASQRTAQQNEALANTANIFNNELGGPNNGHGAGDIWASGGGSDPTHNGQDAYGLFSNVPGTVQAPNGLDAWINFAKNGGTQPSSPIGNNWVAAGGTAPRPATMADLPTLFKNANYPPDSCFTELGQPPWGLHGHCVFWLPDMALAYQQPVPQQSANKVNPNWSNVDYAKAELLTAFQRQDWTAPISAGDSGPRSGLGYYSYGGKALVPGVDAYNLNWPNPQVPVPLQQPGSLTQLIHQCTSPNGCEAQLLAQIHQLCKQIQPKTSDQAIDALLNTTLDMSPYGSLEPQWNKLFIYLPNGDLNNTLAIGVQTPPNYSVAIMQANNLPDGKVWDTACTRHQYDVVNSLVDTMTPGMPCGLYGDDTLHIAPYAKVDPNVQDDLRAYDEAGWTPSSGYKGCLGKMDFANSTLGATTFTHIN